MCNTYIYIYTRISAALRAASILALHFLSYFVAFQWPSLLSILPLIVASIFHLHPCLALFTSLHSLHPLHSRPSTFITLPLYQSAFSSPFISTHASGQPSSALLPFHLSHLPSSLIFSPSFFIFSRVLYIKTRNCSILLKSASRDTAATLWGSTVANDSCPLRMTMASEKRRLR